MQRAKQARRGLLAVAVALLAAAAPVSADRGGPVLHERIPADLGDDAEQGMTVQGGLSAAIVTPHGAVAAPDAKEPVSTDDAAYGAKTKSGSTFRPDRDTRRPEALPYDEPFTPSTAPFKRLSAYDAVNADYTLFVRDPHLVPLVVSAAPPPDATEDRFYADMVVELAPDRAVRIPSVGPGARVLRARAGGPTEEVPISLYKDGADNWFIEANRAIRTRLVMELAVPRAALGGDIGNPSRVALRPLTPLPAAVRAAASRVAAKIGVTPRAAPRETVDKLVAYFRAFRDTTDVRSDQSDIYLDLALGQKGVCRHRAFAFLVTALYLGIPTRMITNEAHAWVEIHDGRMWHRIDLGGAGGMLEGPRSSEVRYEAPADPFRWPPGASTGDEAEGRPSTSGPSTSVPSTTVAPTRSEPASSAPGPSAQASTSTTAPAPSNASESTPRASGPPSTVTMTVATASSRRGAPMPVRGTVASGGEPCANVVVEVTLVGRAGEVPIGSLATDEQGRYEGALVLPPRLPLGDYEARARTAGDSRCGAGQTK